MHEDSIVFPDSLKYNTLNSNRIVYGGGGIMPDYFVPMDTTYNTDYYRDIIRKGILNRFSLNYVDENREKLEREFPDFMVFKEKFIIGDDMMEKLVGYAEEQSLKRNDEDIQTSKDHMVVQLKALIARTIWNSNEYFEIINKLDPIYLKAYEVVTDKSVYDEKLSYVNKWKRKWVNELR